MALQNFKLPSGGTKRVKVHIKDNAGAPVILSSATAVWTLGVTREATPLVRKTTTNGIRIEGSDVIIALDPADTAALAGLYYHELQVTDGNGNVSTVCTGYVTVQADQP